MRSELRGRTGHMSTVATSSTSELRYGLIGAGTMGQEHLGNLALVDGVRVVGIADPHLPSVEKARGLVPGDVTTYTSHQELLARQHLDALIVATPNDTHARILTDIFESGVTLPILCEKPIVTAPEDVDRIRSGAANYGAPIWVGMAYRYTLPMQELVSSVHGGRVGTPWMMAITEHRFPFLHKVGNWNRSSARTGGTLVEKCCHYFDLMRLVLQDEPVRVYASGGSDVNHKHELTADGASSDILDNAFVTVDFSRGSRAMLNLSMFAEGTQYQEYMSVVGDVAKIEIGVPVSQSHWKGTVTTSAYVKLSPRDVHEPHVRDLTVGDDLLRAGNHYGATYFEHQKFQQVVRGEGAVEVTVEDALRAVVIGMAAERSAREHVVVDLDFSDSAVPPPSRTGMP